MMPISSDAGMNLLGKALDGLSQQQQAIANNIANVDTPGYKRQSVPFDQMMRDAMQEAGLSTDSMESGGMAALQGRLDTMVAGKLDGNTVEIEREITDLTETQLKYYMVAQAMSNKLGVVRDIVTRAT